MFELWREMQSNRLVCTFFFFSLLCSCAWFPFGDGIDSSESSDCLQFDPEEEERRRHIVFIRGSRYIEKESRVGSGKSAILVRAYGPLLG